MFALVRPDIAVVAEGVLILLEVLSLLFVLILTYICIIGKPLRAEATDQGLAPFLSRVAIFIVLAAITLAAAHILAHQMNVAMAALAFAIGAAATMAFYFAVLRRHIRPDDMRIQYTMMVWAALGAFSLMALVFLWLARAQISFETKTTISLDVLAQVAGIIVTATGIVFTYVMKSEQSNKTANQKIYQTLELQSVELFRFECDNPDLIKALWFSPPPAAPQDADAEVHDYRVKQYICQMLNLFEMAYRFRVQGIMGEDVFGSWVIWMWELCSAPVFRHFWSDAHGLPANYVKEFRALMQGGVDLQEAALDDDARRTAFFAAVADTLNCDVVEGWFIDAPRRQFVGAGIGATKTAGI